MVEWSGGGAEVGKDSSSTCMCTGATCARVCFAPINVIYLTFAVLLIGTSLKYN